MDNRYVFKTSDDDLHFLKVGDAKKYGINGAVFLSGLRNILAFNSKEKFVLYEIDGLTWIRLSRNNWCELFPYFTPKQIRGIVSKLTKHKVLLTEKFGQMGFDQTLYYTINDER